MSRSESLLDAIHAATHRVPGVPPHFDRAVRAPHGAAPTGVRAHRRRGKNHSPDRPPRVLVGWQRRIAALFGQRLP